MEFTKLTRFFSTRVVMALGLLFIVACAWSDGRSNPHVFAAGMLPPQAEISEGTLLSLDDSGQAGPACPLKHTDVDVSISGFLTRVTVTQEFHNPLAETIEAVYVFPMSQRSAVDDMTMTIGDRTVKGKIKRREEAHAIYEAAKARGQLASLLDQERPNIFTQSVANIPPGADVKMTISYVETLQYEEGSYEFSFPMVVGPRYMPGAPNGRTGGGWSPDTEEVPDASRISPPVTKPGYRAGHDISVKVSLDAGVPVQNITSKSHKIDVEKLSTSQAAIRLQSNNTIPNKDFILSYQVAGAKIEDSLLTHRTGEHGYFTLILQPPERVTAEDVTPKELVFVIDSSGSMSGFPIEKAKEVIKLAVDGLYPRDTFNLITFAGDTHVLFPEPVPATNSNIRKAQDFLQGRQGGGGTEMMKAIRTALSPSNQQDHIRIVAFMTDGYVGNDMAILGEIRKYHNARIFSFGIGNSVNRFLLDKMAETGRGEVEYVTLSDDGSAAALRFHERLRNPLLTDVSIDWGGLPVTDVYPRRIPDLFSAKPVIVTGRYTGPARGMIRLTGKMSGTNVIRTVPADFSGYQTDHAVLSTLWARQRVGDLMSQDWDGMQNGQPSPAVRQQIVELGLQHRLVTQFTSFVAVEETTVTEGGVPRRVDVPVEMPVSVSYEGVFGENKVTPMKTMAFRQKSGLGGGMERLDLSGPRSAVAAMPLEQAEERDEAVAPSTMIMHPDLLKLAQGASVPGLTVRDGKVEVEIWLEDANSDVLGRLKRLGFTVIVQTKFSKVIIGSIPIGRLLEAARLSGIRAIAAHRSGG